MADQPQAAEISETAQIPDLPPEKDLPVGMHPLIAAIAISGWAWTLLVWWIVFFIKWAPEALVNLVMVTGTSAVLVAFITGLGYYTRGVASRSGRMTRQAQSFRDFLNSEVEVGTGRIKGSECFELALGVGITCAILGTGFGIGIGLG